jgi:hypothetical protein
MTGKRKPRPKGVLRTPEKETDRTKRLLELLRSAADLDDEEDEDDEEAERLTEQIWAAIRAAIQSRELPGRE